MREDRLSRATTQILFDLISIRSDVQVDGGCNERGMINFVADWLNNCPGWKVTRQQVQGERQNVIAQTQGEPKLVLLGHLDTVPVTEAKQIRPIITKDRLIGRGAVDMKAGVAIMLQLAARFAPDGVVMVFTVDEEYSFQGIKKFLTEYRWKPRLVLNPEPTDLDYLGSARGVAEAEFVIQGKAVHAGRRLEGRNAIVETVLLTNRLEQALQKRDEGSLKSSVNLAALQGGLLSSNGEILTRPNVVPDYAQGVLEVRLGFRIKERELSELMLTLAKRQKIDCTKLKWNFIFQPLLQDKNELRDFLEVVEEYQKPKEIEPNTAGFYEVQLLQESWNCPVVAFGPGPMSTAHQDEEWVSLAELERAEKILIRYLEKQVQ